MGEFLGGLFELFLELFLDGVTETAVHGSRKVYRIFTAICAVLLVAALAAGIWAHLYGNSGILLLCVVGGSMVLVVWAIPTVRRLVSERRQRKYRIR